jgi:hypothetical protein
MLRSSVVPGVFALLLAACTSTSDDEVGGEGEESETAGEPEVVTLVINADPALVCGEEGGPIEFETRRVDCWDPPLPCTVAQDPPWIVGTSGTCDTIGTNSVRFEVEVSQTGRWETRLQSGAELACWGLGGEARTNVSNDDLASRAELLLTLAPTGECGEP